MLYQRSLEIERRLETVVRLIRTGHYSTPRLAERLGVSIPTVSRYVTALRGGDTTSGQKNIATVGTKSLCDGGRPEANRNQGKSPSECRPRSR